MYVCVCGHTYVHVGTRLCNVLCERVCVRAHMYAGYTYVRGCAWRVMCPSAHGGLCALM